MYALTRIIWIAIPSICMFFFIQAEEILPEWKATFNSLSTEEKKILDKFFKTMIAESEGGYVLFGSKPLCTEGIIAPKALKTDWIGELHHQRSVNLFEGYQIWNQHFASLKSQKLIICCKNTPSLIHPEWIHLIWINPISLKETIGKNLTLFQYVLGPQLTPENMLCHLTDPSLDILEDSTLMGILMGFGTQNALYYRRLELIVNELRSRENVPLINKYKRINIPDPFKGRCMGFDQNPVRETPPSITYHSLCDEYQALKKSSTSSRVAVNERLNPIPLFSIYKQDEETIEILENYRVDRKKIIHFLEHDNFLEQTLSLIFQ